MRATQQLIDWLKESVHRVARPMLPVSCLSIAPYNRGVMGSKCSCRSLLGCWRRTWMPGLSSYREWWPGITTRPSSGHYSQEKWSDGHYTHLLLVAQHLTTDVDAGS